MWSMLTRNIYLETPADLERYRRILSRLQIHRAGPRRFCCYGHEDRGNLRGQLEPSRKFKRQNDLQAAKTGICGTAPFSYPQHRGRRKLERMDITRTGKTTLRQGRAQVSPSSRHCPAVMTGGVLRSRRPPARSPYVIQRIRIGQSSYMPVQSSEHSSMEHSGKFDLLV